MKGHTMRHRRHAKIALAIMLLTAASSLYVLVRHRYRMFPTGPVSEPKTGAQTQPAQTSLVLVNGFIRWYELQFIKRMRHVGSFSTDVNDLVNEVGLEKTLDRYVALREVNLEYALQHPDCRTIPEDDLQRLAQKQFEHIMSNTRVSRMWIDYTNPKLIEGSIKSLKDTSLVWIPFYQKLLAGPSPSGGELEANMRARVSRNEYAKTMERVAQTKASLHESMKEGIAWYASWLSWSRTMADRAGKQDIAACRATVRDIYGDAAGAENVVVEDAETRLRLNRERPPVR
jgi:hypothetical protein